MVCKGVYVYIEECVNGCYLASGIYIWIWLARPFKYIDLVIGRIYQNTDVDHFLDLNIRIHFIVAEKNEQV